MNCPVCKEPMIVVDHENVEVDFCVECHGIWLDAGEIELLFGDAEACAKFLSIGQPAVVPPGEKRRRCPICLKKMTKESTSGDAPITFDHCPQGDGLWLDEGELATILTQSETLGAGTEVAAFLLEVFPRKQSS